MAKNPPWDTDTTGFDAWQKGLCNFLSGVYFKQQNYFADQTGTYGEVNTFSEAVEIERNEKKPQRFTDEPSLVKNYKTHFDQIKHMHFLQAADLEGTISECIKDERYFYIGYAGSARTYMWKTEPTTRMWTHLSWPQLKLRTGRYPLKLKTYFCVQTEKVNEKALVKKYFSKLFCLNGKEVDTMPYDKKKKTAAYVYVLVYQVPQVERILSEVRQMLLALPTSVQQKLGESETETLCNELPGRISDILRTFRTSPGSSQLTPEIRQKTVDVLCKGVGLREICYLLMQKQLQDSHQDVKEALLTFKSSLDTLHGFVVGPTTSDQLNHITLPKHVKLRYEPSDDGKKGILCSVVEIMSDMETSFKNSGKDYRDPIEKCCISVNSISDIEECSVNLQKQAMELKCCAIFLQEQAFELLDSVLMCNQVQCKAETFLQDLRKDDQEERIDKEVQRTEFFEDRDGAKRTASERIKPFTDALRTFTDELDTFTKAVKAETQQRKNDGPPATGGNEASSQTANTDVATLSGELEKVL